MDKYPDHYNDDEEEIEYDDEDAGWSNADVCYECTGYGDDYFINEDGELESACDTCPFNTAQYDEYENDGRNY